MGHVSLYESGILFTQIHAWCAHVRQQGSFIATRLYARLETRNDDRGIVLV